MRLKKNFFGIVCLFTGLTAFVAYQIPSFQSDNISEKWIKGVSFVGPRNPIDSNAFAPLQSISTKWVCLMPYAFSFADSANLIRESPRQWWGERKEGVATCIRLAKAKGMKIMLKPHLWIIRGGFTGKLEFKTEQDWQKWETQYADYVLDFARLADSMEVELFCIGTELERFTQTRTDFWKKLIAHTKKVYKGKLTYAANWDEFERVPFWKEMDFIGVDAYFPLSPEAQPSIDSLKNYWIPYRLKMQQLSKKFKKQIIFTEFGYKSTDFTTYKPWESRTNHPFNAQAQANAYEALFLTFQKENWFAGGFIWKWYAHHATSGGENNKDYTPQNKITESVIKKWFSTK